MSYEAVVIEADERQPGSSNQAKRLRAAGKLPAVVYGEERDPRPIIVTPRTIVEILQSDHGQNTILTLKVADGREQTALIHDYDVDPISHKLVHCDFKRISMDVAVEVTVPIEVVGEPVGVLVDKGILDMVLREVDVRCLPGAIPDNLPIDVSELQIGDSIAVSQLEIPEGVEILADGELTIATVAAPQELEVETTEEDDLLGELQEPELIGRSSDEDEEDEG
jgi:large subunit ribosomal protein L25